MTFRPFDNGRTALDTADTATKYNETLETLLPQFASFCLLSAHVHGQKTDRPPVSEMPLPGEIFRRRLLVKRTMQYLADPVLLSVTVGGYRMNHVADLI